MTERAKEEQLRRRLSLSKNKKKGDAQAGTSATKTPITAFFSSQPPPKLACPLCGQLVPRFRINEHIDLQCQNFDRGDGISSTKTPPRCKTPEQVDPQVEETDEGTKTSPYFKKNNFQQTPREVTSKTVVRTIDLGSLSSKLSRRCKKEPERKSAEDKNASEEAYSSETLSSSQKENVIIQTLEGKKSFDAPTAVEDPSCSEKGRKKSKSVTIQSSVTPNSNPSKRKKEITSRVSLSGFQKKAKREGSSGEPEEISSSEKPAETSLIDQHKTEVSFFKHDPPLDSEETNMKNILVTGGNSEPESVTETSAGDQNSQTSSLPYYLRNFRTILHAVLENEDDRTLFNQDDMSLVQAFEKLSCMFQFYY